MLFPVSTRHVDLRQTTSAQQFLDEIIEEYADFERIWPIFVSFWPLIYTPCGYLWLF